MSKALKIVGQEFVYQYQPTVREEVNRLEERTLEVVREGGSLVPLMAEQKSVVYDLTRQVYVTLRNAVGMTDQGFTGFVSGGYARGSCVFGVDYDLGFMYDGADRARFYPLENAILITLSRLFNTPRSEIHNGLIGCEGEWIIHDTSLTSPSLTTLFLARYFTRRLDNLLVYSNAWKRTQGSLVLSMILDPVFRLHLDFLVRYCDKSPALFRQACLSGAERFCQGTHFGDGHFNFEHIFGDQPPLEDIQSVVFDRERELHEEDNDVWRNVLETAENADRELSQLTGTARFPLDITKPVKHLGVRIAFQFLSLLGRLEDSPPQTLTDYMESEEIAAYFGGKYQDFIWHIERLLKIRALVSIYAQRAYGENPSLILGKYRRKFKGNELGLMAHDLGCSTSEELFKSIIESARFINQTIIGLTSKIT